MLYICWIAVVGNCILMFYSNIYHEVSDDISKYKLVLVSGDVTYSANYIAYSNVLLQIQENLRPIKIKLFPPNFASNMSDRHLLYRCTRSMLLVFSGVWIAHLLLLLYIYHFIYFMFFVVYVWLPCLVFVPGFYSFDYR